MTNEKAELPNDQVSLPPTYAPSETFTDSPPPAYRKSGMAAVKVARIVCFTFLAMTFVIGFFVVTHKWIQGRECNCNQETSGNIHHAAFLSQAPSLQSNLNNDKIEDNIIRKEGEENKFLPGDSRQREEEDIPEEQVVDSPEMTPKDEEDESVEELNKDLKLPKDLLLGNPQLAGRNVHCKVEKRQRRITEGIMTQAIIVTCDDDDEDAGVGGPGIEPQMSLVPIQPPMSLLSTIMKVLSTRPPTVEDESTEEPERLPFPMGPMNRPLPGPAPVQRTPLPWIQPLDRPFFRPFPGPIAPVLVPLKNIEMGRHFHANQKEEEPNQPGPFQQSPSMAEDNRAPRIHGMAPPLRFIQRPFPDNRQGPPFPLPHGAFPIRVIRLSPRAQELPTEEEENPQETQQDFDRENQGPMPLHPLMRFFPQGGRIIRLRPRPPMDESENKPLPFPFPRGALPPPPPESLSVPHPMPEASGRALPSPVALPQGVRVVRLPFRPPQPFPEAKLITHMEVRQPREESQEPRNKPQLQNIPENQSFQENTKEFGPPKTHTVIDNNTPLVYGDGQPQEEEESLPEIFPQDPITQSDPQPRFVAPPPPRFAREGRTSFHAQLNPDAEVIPQHPIPAASQPVHRIVLN